MRVTEKAVPFLVAFIWEEGDFVEIITSVRRSLGY